MKVSVPDLVFFGQSPSMTSHPPPEGEGGDEMGFSRDLCVSICKKVVCVSIVAVRCELEGGRDVGKVASIHAPDPVPRESGVGDARRVARLTDVVERPPPPWDRFCHFC